MRAVIEPVKIKLTSHSEIIVNIECLANDHESYLADLRANMSKLTSLGDLLSKKFENLEGHYRSNNIRLMVYRRALRVLEFFAGLLQDLLGLEEKPDLDLECSLHSRPHPNDHQPRWLICQSSFQVHYQIQQKAREVFPIVNLGQRITIFPDFTAVVAKKCAAF